jgi:type I restriction enzyme, S subunit
MIRDLKPYPAYKDSGVQWLGDVPEHWQVRPSRVLFKEVKDQNHPEAPLLSVTISRGVISQSDLLSDTSKKDSSNLDKSKYKLIRPGDIAYNKMRAWQGAIGASRLQGIISPAYVVQRPRNGVLPDYMHYLFRTPSFATEAERWSYGITSDQWNLRPEHFKMIYCSLPPWDEQSAIVRFLHGANHLIRRYISSKQKLIKLLEEKKQAIIHNAVTHSFGTNIRLKPSAVEWLGDVPEHWEVLPIKRAFTSMDYGISESATDDGTIRLLTMGNIKDGEVTIPETGGVTTVDTALLLFAGDLLFNRTNSPDLVGKVGLFRGSDSAVTFASYLVRMRPRPGNEPEYLNLVLNDVSITSIARREAIPSLHQSNLNPTRYGRLQITLPPTDEQRSILRYVNVATTDVERAIASAHREISLLREYGTRLLADVVTGKLDVRKAAVQLPDETDDPQELLLADAAMEEGDEADELASEEPAGEGVVS